MSAAFARFSPARSPESEYHHEMEPDDLKPVEHLDADECWRLLRTTSVGRLAVSVSDMPDIFPVNYVVSNGHMLFRTAPGSKLAHVAVNKQVKPRHL